MSMSVSPPKAVLGPSGTSTPSPCPCLLSLTPISSTIASWPIVTQASPSPLKMTPARSFAAVFCLSQKAAILTSLPCLVKDLSVEAGVWVWFVVNSRSRRESLLCGGLLQHSHPKKGLFCHCRWPLTKCLASGRHACLRPSFDCSLSNPYALPIPSCMPILFTYSTQRPSSPSNEPGPHGFVSSPPPMINHLAKVT